MPGPVPAETNPAITPWYYQPTTFPISAVTRGATTTVTLTAVTTGGTTVNPNFVIGQEVRFLIPNGYGIRQLNNQKGYVLSLPSSTSVEVDIDSTSYNAFIVSPSGANSSAQLVPVGDINSGQVNTSGRTNQLTYIPGSFIDIS
jgi:hypothetical protein